jgi:hypothetical protein
MAERNLRNRTVPASETDESENQVNSLAEVSEVGVEDETSTDGGVVVTAPNMLTRQEGSIEHSAVIEPEKATMSTMQLHVLLLDVVSSLKADIATAVETMNSNFKAENVKLVADITSSLTC